MFSHKNVSDYHCNQNSCCIDSSMVWTDPYFWQKVNEEASKKKTKTTKSKISVLLVYKKTETDYLKCFQVPFFRIYLHFI